MHFTLTLSILKCRTGIILYDKDYRNLKKYSHLIFSEREREYLKMYRFTAHSVANQNYEHSRPRNDKQIQISIVRDDVTSKRHLFFFSESYTNLEN